MSDIIQFNYKDHWQEKEINLERSNVGNKSLGFTISGGIDIPFVNHHFTSIVITHITENGLAYRDKRLKLYDIILRVNDIDFTNIKYQTAVDILRNSGQKIQLLIRRLSPPISEEIELEHNGRLGICIGGGIGNNYFRKDHGIFITDIDKQQTNKQLDIGDRLLQISSTYNTYDLRFVTHEMAKKYIQLACKESQKIKLYVGHTRPGVQVQKRTVLRQGQYDPLGSKDEDSVQVNENNYSFVSAKNHHVKFEDDNVNHEMNDNLIVSFDFDGTHKKGVRTSSSYVVILDYQRYENRGKVLKNRLLNGQNTNSSKVLLTEDRKRLHPVRFAAATTVTEFKTDPQMNADSGKCNDKDQHRNVEVRSISGF
ncbi:unnamed protein product [Rotaria sp. Silwood1]|nr:unnamed protein product [Rotaria sp. Silwood1]